MIKFKAEKLLPIASAALGVAAMLVSNAIQANDKKNLKAELKSEIMNDLLKNED